jgi:2-polyprenyl-6-methoxyphenol hydroxylase-like FAD-dependent oxidoreductase
MSDSRKTQVLIIGAGPTGLMMAAQLVRYNVDFILLEKNKAITHLTKAIAIQARSLEIFQELGIDQQAIEEGRITNGMNLFYKGQRLAAIDLAGLGKGMSQYSFALSLEQSKTEKMLLDHLQKLGKSVEWGSAIVSFHQNDEVVNAEYVDGMGRTNRIEAKYLVGCDGAGSDVRHLLDLSFDGTTEPKLFYVADVVLESRVINANELYMFMIKRGFVLFFPMEGEGHYRIVGVVPDGEKVEVEGKIGFADIETAFLQIAVDVKIKTLSWFSTYKVHSRKATKFMKGRCFIAGDAAHIHTPAGGQGMNTGLQDAYNLAWKIAYRLRGEVNDEVLATYDMERSANAKRLLSTTDRIFDIMSGVNRFWNFLRITLFPLILKQVTRSGAVRKRLFPLISQTSIAYPGSYLTFKSSIGKVKAGDRMHYFEFRDGTSIFQYLKEPVFKLLYFGEKGQLDIAEIEKMRLNIKVLRFAEIPSKLFGSEKEFYVLLRPDNHVSYIGKSLEECTAFVKLITSN